MLPLFGDIPLPVYLLDILLAVLSMGLLMLNLRYIY